MAKNYLPVVCLNLLFLLPTAICNIIPLAPALYVFGDSLFDSGNNNYLQTLSKANFTPYGIDFINGPTGRFTNGRTVVDFFAQKLSLPFAPPYLSLVGKIKPTTGVNYASGSCGILDETGSRLGVCLPMNKQIDYFEATIEELKRQYILLKFFADKYLAESILAITIGSNDYFNNYLQPDFYNTSSLTPDQFAQLLVDTLSQQLTRLYRIGARKFVVFDIGPVGCIPAVVAASNSTGPCVDAVNQLLVIYNQKLKIMLSNLRTELRGSHIVFGATYNTSLDMNLHPVQFGFLPGKVPCCPVDAALGTCIPGGTPCGNRNIHLTYDAIHPSERVDSFFANNCFDQSPSVCSPLTVKQLAAA